MQLPDLPVGESAGREQMEARLREPLPERALRVTGVRHVGVLAADRDQRLVPGELATVVAADRAAGRLEHA